MSSEVKTNSHDNGTCVHPAGDACPAMSGEAGREHRAIPSAETAAKRGLGELDAAPDCATCKIDIAESPRNRYARIQPLGFWADVVKVNQSQGWGDATWGEIEISWSAGGTDGKLSGIPLVDSFIHALNHAKDIAEGWAQRASEQKG